MEIADIGRFENVRKFHSYAGVIPSTHSSGDRTYHGRIVKEGNRWLRWAAVEDMMLGLGIDGWTGGCVESSGVYAGKNIPITFIDSKEFEEIVEIGEDLSFTVKKEGSPPFFSDFYGFFLFNIEFPCFSL